MSMFRKAQQTVAHQSTLPSGLLGNRDLKSLQEVINSEKEFVKSNSRSAQDFHKTSEAIKTWGQSEGDDLQDILNKLSLLFDHYTTAQNRFNSHLSTIRQHFKSIRTREESLADLRARKRSLGSKIEGVEKKLHKMSPENKELPKTTIQLKELRAEMDSLRAEVSAEEAAIGDFKRRTTKDAMSIKCAGLLEFAEKMMIVGDVGKLMIEEISLAKTQPGMPREEYRASARTEELLHDATQGIANVAFAPVSSSGNHRYADMSQAHQQGDETNYDNSGMNYYDTTQGGGDNLEADEENAYDYDSSAAAWNQPGAAAGDSYAGGPERAQYSLQNQHAPGSQSHQHEGLNTYDGDTSVPHSPTPIYATHSSSNRNRAVSNASYGGAPQHQFDSQDSAAAKWTRSAVNPGSAPAMRASGSGGSHPIADQYQSRSPDEVQVGGQGLRVVGNAEEDSIDRSNIPALPSSAAAPRLQTPPPQDNSFGYETPGIDTSAPHAGAGPSTPAVIAANNAVSAAQDDESYFQSVGSTRAAQQASRRPMSPAGNTARQFSSTIASGGNAEGQGEGRKMTAAAFRKGFGRMPSSQQQGPGNTNFGASTASLGAGIARPGSAAGSMYGQQPQATPGSPAIGQIYEHPASSTAPLAIRKQAPGGHTGVAEYDYGNAGSASGHGQQQQQQQQQQHYQLQDGPAPPYDGPHEHQPRMQSIYGGMTTGEEGQDHQQPEYYAPPPQPWHPQYNGPGSRSSSRPTSAAGWK